MSFEKLEVKIHQAIDIISLLQIKIKELKEQNTQLLEEVNQAAGYREALMRENEQLKEEQNARQERLRSLLGRIDKVS
ncbi:cell division protein ZapB [Candidatus Profftia sp. (ex Adelges kitamiensis)]|uniref:cell division protein ZapB n=1 Tax=Candidatus Profftia sp. (ex Adelges kitamiensis) TaxID=2864218 RepID=UPI001CE345A7|nr:cell division protein ZapB [Candidatus Profftia sp. (ex Adelges kitamiensis)]